MIAGVDLLILAPPIYPPGLEDVRLPVLEGNTRQH
jgi:hypothetical protein